ncbi:MAG: hypothetical protein GY802_15010 [Gammaproteobacteria bacterium]|nr:hypothetical protein [Gammaproteobacteria bacterium]
MLTPWSRGTSRIDGRALAIPGKEKPPRNPGTGIQKSDPADRFFAIASGMKANIIRYAFTLIELVCL